MNELTQLVDLMKEMNERLKRIEENTRPAVVADDRCITAPAAPMRWPADFDGAHHVTEPK